MNIKNAGTSQTVKVNRRRSDIGDKLITLERYTAEFDEDGLDQLTVKVEMAIGATTEGTGSHYLEWQDLPSEVQKEIRREASRKFDPDGSGRVDID